MITREQCYDDGFEWIELEAPDEQELAEIARRFHLHRLAVEDALHAHQRTKLERYGDSWFLVLKSADYRDSQEVVDLHELMAFVGPTFFITVSHGAGDVIARAREVLEADPQQLALGPFAALHMLLDALIDEYAVVVDNVAVDIDQIQGQVFSGDRRNHAERIFKLKREVLEFRQAVSPLATGFGTSAVELSIVPEPLHAYYRDVIDHARRLNERIETQDALLSDALHANAAAIGTRQNEDMRKISSWAAIISVPTMIAGVYGMNFRHMPELEARWGYPFVLLVMAGACTWLYRNFRRRGWL